MNPLDARLDAIITPALESVAPAVSLVVMHKGNVITERAWGFIDPETRRIPVTTATRFDLASLTKLFTTTALLGLLSEAGLSIETPLVALLPEFGAITPRQIDGGQDPHSKQRLPVAAHLAGETVDPADVTLRHLLTHTSGLPAWRDVYRVAPAPRPPDKRDPVSPAKRWQRTLTRLNALPFVDRVGAAVRYSDIGLMLLGEVVARLNESDFETAITRRVLRPLNRCDACFNPVRDYKIPFEQIAPTEIDPTWRRRRVWGEVHDENADGVGGTAGHAGLFAGARSVAALGQAWLEGAHRFGITPELHHAATREQAETDGERRGLGWMLKSHEGSSAGDHMSADAYGHTGFTGTSLWVDPERELVAALLTNRVYMGRAVPGIHPLRRTVHDAIVEAVT